MGYRFDVCVIGGMGPLATAELMRRIVLYTDAKCDSEHVCLCVLSDPRIPDRSRFITERCENKRTPALPKLNQMTEKERPFSTPRLTETTKKEHVIFPPKLTKASKNYRARSPLKAIKRQIRIAKKLRCRHFAVACNTAHLFYEKFEKIRGIKFINTVKETAAYAYSLYPDRDLCVLATPGTVKADIYRKNAPRGAKIAYPSEMALQKTAELIAAIKSGRELARCNPEAVIKLLKKEFDTDRNVFILGCTELSLVSEAFADLTVIDSTDVLAARIITASKKRFKAERFPTTG